MVQAALIGNKPSPQFKRVFMSLADIVEDRFLAEYIKKGMNILYALLRH